MDAKVVVKLSDGERIVITDVDLKPIYDELWSRAKDIVGAASTAAMIHHAMRHSRVDLGREIVLSDSQSSAFREVMTYIRNR